MKYGSIFCIVLITFFSSLISAQFNSNQHPDDIYWGAKFAHPGLFNRARVVTNYNGSTAVFASHFFELPNDTSLGLDSYLLGFWDGVNWKIEGPGRISDFNGEAITCICVVGTDVYIGGNFTTLGSEPIAYLAKWDGNSWSSVGGGVNGQVRALAVDENLNLYVGGSFNQAGGDTANNIAMWDGTNWSPLEDQGGNGVNNNVNAIAVDTSGIYIGGGFTTAGGFNNIRFAAKYNNQGSWESMGVQWNTGAVYSIAIAPDHIYLGGAFYTFNGAPGNGIVKSDTSRVWEALGNGSTDVVQKIMVNAGGTVYALGNFSADAGPAGNRIAKWNGTSWEALGDEPFEQGETVDFAFFEPNTIYTTRFAFQNPNYIYGNGIYKWDGSNWSGIGQGVGEYWTNALQVKTLEWYDSKLIAGGNFQTAGDKFINSLAQFDGNSWSDLGGNSTTPFYYISDLLTKDGNLYAGGYFTNIGGINANNIAVWNGSTWSNLGLGVDNPIEAIHSIGNDIYVTGGFFNAGGSPAVGYARWDGSSWHAWSSGGPFAYTLTSIGSDIYAGGRFSYLNGGALYVGNIARWDGTTWNELQGGVSGAGFSQIATVFALAVSGNNLIVGGDFEYAGTTPANNIAIWDGSQWSELGGGIEGTVRAILVEGNDIYVGGQFTMVGTNIAYSIARWDGSVWHPLGTGLRQSNNFIATPKVNSILPTPDGLYIGGQFTHAGDKYSNMIALYTDFVTSVEDEIDIVIPSKFQLKQNYPNPFNPSTKISYSVPTGSFVTLKVYDMLGRQVAILVNEEKPVGNYNVDFDAGTMSSGIYFYRIEAGDFVNTRKMILMK
jgi:hypothetical protein